MARLPCLKSFATLHAYPLLTSTSPWCGLCGAVQQRVTRSTPPTSHQQADPRSPNGVGGARCHCHSGDGVESSTRLVEAMSAISASGSIPHPRLARRHGVLRKVCAHALAPRRRDEQIARAARAQAQQCKQRHNVTHFSPRSVSQLISTHNGARTLHGGASAPGAGLEDGRVLDAQRHPADHAHRRGVLCAGDRDP